MHRRLKNRLLTIFLLVSMVVSGVALLLYAMEDNIVFFYAPSEIKEIHLNKEIRVGGLVKTGSIKQLTPDSIEFIVTDLKQDLAIYYQGIVPLLFREGQGIVAQGRLVNNVFIARVLLTKHDENYKPPVSN